LIQRPEALPGFDLADALAMPGHDAAISEQPQEVK
jgi:hypothetical protein